MATTNLRQHLADGATTEHNDLSLVVEGQEKRQHDDTEDASCNKEDADTRVSPTSVLVSSSNDEPSSTKQQQQQADHQHPWQALQANLMIGMETVQTQVQNGIVQVQTTTNKLTSQVVVDRKSITVSVLSILLTISLLAGGTLLLFGTVALLTSPFWLPVAIVTSPLWLPLMIVSSPLWLTVVMVGTVCCVCSAGTLLGIVFFFAWPQEWLPHRNSKLATSYLYYRNQATKALVKMQAKLILYAAGVGPLADAAFCILDRIDLEQLSRELQELDLQQVTEDLKRMDVGAVQASLWRILQSVLR